MTAVAAGPGVDESSVVAVVGSALGDGPRSIGSNAPSADLTRLCSTMEYAASEAALSRAQVYPRPPTSGGSAAGLKISKQRPRGFSTWSPNFSKSVRFVEKTKYRAPRGAARTGGGPGPLRRSPQKCLGSLGHGIRAPSRSSV